MGWGALGTTWLPCLATGGSSLSFALFHFPDVFCFSQAQKSHLSVCAQLSEDFVPSGVT